ncbi:MAG: fructose,6-bisphosphatase [Gaiellales bacterium]|jgi:fructose-1,6-bisphosphatase II|nr:fructose,6-bisphosphatase [Gaiellales bacterium]
MSAHNDRCLCTELVSVTERSALALGRSLGRGDPARALDEGLRGIREGLDLVPLTGRIAIGIDGQLPVDTVLGAGGRQYDLAIGPLQEAIVARGQVGVISVLAATDPGGMLTVPPMYMRKLAVGHVARGHIDLLAPVSQNILAIAEAFGRKPMDITAIVLDRDRHDDLIEEIRETGARIKLIQDGDVTAAISSAIRGTNDHVAIGIGGAAEGVISAAALTCLGGEFQGQLWPVSRSQVRATAELGIEDMLHVFTDDELVRGDAIVVATGVSNGDLLRGVRYVADAARTHSIVMCTRCNRVRFVDSTHNFVRERGLEVRL